MVLMASAINCVYGSALSPPRLQQVVECLDDYFQHADHNEPFFQSFLPLLVQQLRSSDISVGSPNNAEVVLDSLHMGLFRPWHIVPT